MRLVTIIGENLDFTNSFLKFDAHGSALRAALPKGDLGMIELLIEKGAKLEVKMNAGVYGSKLHDAAIKGRKKSLEILLDAGAIATLALKYGGYYKNLETAVEGVGTYKISYINRES